ncbi:MAG TPA: hypothetical protein VJ044_05790, partial [Candidatus Hodarchaeales archaeon]|nr:hypothetical protein [Candidatus Hodarchaeales archaeon]
MKHKITAFFHSSDVHPEPSTLNEERIKCITTGQCVERVFVEKALKSSLPIMIGSKWCRLNTLKETPLEAWALGEDPYNIGGYVILNGKPKTVGGMYSHTMNSPMSVFTTLEFQRVRSDIMTRLYANGGNTYHLVPTLIRVKEKLEGKKTTINRYDLVIEIPWNQADMNPKDQTLKKERPSLVPIYALFCYYGANGHKQMANYIFPGVDENDARVQVLRDAIVNGPFHRELRAEQNPITPESSLLHIGKKILSPEAKTRFKNDIEKDFAILQDEMTLSDVEKESMLKFLLEERIKKRTKEILDGTFFFKVNHDPQKVCMSMGSIVA